MHKWIQQAHIKKGGLHRELHIPQGKKIPSGIIDRIVKAKIGTSVKVDGHIKVTPLLKHRAIFAKNVRR